MKRRADWQEQMTAAIDLASLCRFQWGVHDCFLFVCYVADRMCDTTLVEQVKARHPYRDELAAHNVIRGYGTFKDAVSAWLGEPIAPRLARRGDAVLLRNADKLVMGIVDGHRAVCAADDGVGVTALDYAICAWRIG